MKAIRVSIALLSFAATALFGITAVTTCNLAYSGLSAILFTATERKPQSTESEPLESVLTATQPMLPAEKTADYFIDPDGVFFVFPDDESSLGREFAGFKSITIETYRFEQIGDEYIQKKINPQGSIRAAAEYKFTKLVVVNREVTFETEKIGAVYYRFSGFYPNRYEEIDCEECEHPGELEGTLEKIENGRTTKTGKIRFYTEGC